MKMIRIGDLILNEQSITSVDLNYQHTQTFYSHPNDKTKTFTGVQIITNESQYGENSVCRFFGKDAELLRAYFIQNSFAIIEAPTTPDPVQAWAADCQAEFDRQTEEARAAQAGYGDVPF